jgi:hypothetical protein
MLLWNEVWVHRIRISGSLVAALPKGGGPNKWLVLSRIPETPHFKSLIYSPL